MKNNVQQTIYFCILADIDINKAISFLVSAKKNAYPVNENKVQSPRIKSSDFFMRKMSINITIHI